MATAEILSLKPKTIWKHFHSLTQIPRPTGQMNEVTRFVMDFGKALNLETKKDKVGNVVIIKPATKGYESAKTVILKANLQLVFHSKKTVVHIIINSFKFICGK